MNSTFTNYFMERGTSSSGMISMLFASDGYQRIIQSYGGSTAFRELGMLLGLQSFFSHFFLGVGIGTITSTSGLISILSNIGIIGFISLVIFWKKIFVSLFDKRLSNIAIFIGLLSQLVLGGIADYSFSPLLILLIYLLQISKYQSKNEINRKPLNSYIVQQGCELCKN